MSPWLIAGPVLAIIVVVFSFIGYTAFKRLHIPWERYDGMLWFGPAEPTRIRAALLQAAHLLVKHTKWSLDDLTKVSLLARVYVMPTESWSDEGSQKVAGQQVGSILVVGPSLSALCHELAHLCEAQISKSVDYSHATWAAKGIYAAVDEYEAWLKL